MDITKCRTCKKDKTENNFGEYSGKKRRNCEDCRKWLQEYNLKNREHLLEVRRARYHADPERKVAKANKEYMQKMRENPRRYRQLKNNHLQRKYGITIEQYDKMLELQNNKCAICGYDFPDSKKLWNRPCVDHCHRTHKVRGILCRKCNIMLFWLDTNQNKEAAERYLRFKGAEDKEPLT